MKTILTLTALLITLNSTIYAKSENREPPKEAIEVCVGQNVESICTMETPRGSLTGKCMNTPDEKYFACMPEGGPDKNAPERK
jgi:hypothetical protein